MGLLGFPIVICFLTVLLLHKDDRLRRPRRALNRSRRPRTWRSAYFKGHRPTKYQPSLPSKVEPAPHLLSCSVDLPITVFDTARAPNRGRDSFTDNFNDKNGSGDSFYGPATPCWCQARGSAKACLAGVVRANAGKFVRYD
jgi:hypothetical protein